MKIKDITNEWIPMYSTMKAYGMSKAKHPDGSGYFKTENFADGKVKANQDQAG